MSCVAFISQYTYFLKMKKIILIFCIAFAIAKLQAQNVGINTTTPTRPLTIFANVFGMVQTNGVDTMGTWISPSGTALPYAWTGTLTNIPYRISSGRDNNHISIMNNGKVGIGNGVQTPSSPALLEVDGRIKINGGTPGTGKVLTTDATGLASWETPSGGFSLPYSGSSNSIGTASLIIANTASSLGVNTGIIGQASNGIGVFGQANSPTSLGVYGQSVNGNGVLGESISNTGIRGLSTSGFGVQGLSDTNTALYGFSGSGNGLYAETNGGTAATARIVNNFGTGNAVDANNNSATNATGKFVNADASVTSIGISGQSTNGYGVIGQSTSNVGVQGFSDTFVGIRGQSTSSVGVVGSSNTDTGIHGQSNSGIGVKGISGINTAIEGVSTSGIGVKGIGTNGVYGFSGSGNGVFGNSISGYGVHGLSDTNTALYGFSGSGNGLYAEVNGGTAATARIVNNNGTGNAVDANNNSATNATGKFVNNNATGLALETTGGLKFGGSGVGTPATGKVLTATDNLGNATWQTSAGTASELEKITEGGLTGYRILGRDPANYGNIGNDAIDLSYSGSPSTTKGALNHYSIAMGFETTASGDRSTAMGQFTTAYGHISTAMGVSTIANSYGSVAMGILNDPIAGSSQGSWQPSDPILTVGNGLSNSSRKNALTIFKNGNHDIQGYTRLGTAAEGAPRIKTKKITGTTTSADNTFFFAPHGVDASKILSISTLVTDGGYQYLPHSPDAGVIYTVNVDGANIAIGVKTAALSSSVMGKPFKILITYEE